MKIDLNKDFEEQYKNELWKGFTARELLYGAVALLVAGTIAIIVRKATGLAINICIYAVFLLWLLYYTCNGEASRTYMDRIIKKYLVLYADKGTAL